MKYCKKCDSEKPIDDFNKDKSRPDGLFLYCKQCTRATAAAWRTKNKGKISERSAKYYRENREKLVEKSAKYYNENKDKAAKSSKKWAEKNKEKVRKIKREHYERNASEVKRKAAEWGKRNPEKVALKGKLYRLKNRERVNAYARNRRSRVSDADGYHCDSDILKMLSNQDWKCANCKIDLSLDGPEKYHVDHIMPLFLGGSNWPENLQCLCPKCNLAKGAKDPIDWASENGRLL